MLFIKNFNNINYKKILIYFWLIIFLVISIILILHKNTDNPLLAIKTNAGIWKQEGTEEIKKDYIKWVNCNLTVQVMEATSKLDISSHANDEPIKFNWIELISYLACGYGNDFTKFKQKDLDNLVEKLRNGITMEELTKDSKYYNYYFESYSAILEQVIGEYEIEEINEYGEKTFSKKYGLKAFLPIAKGYNFNHYDDFGNSRSYGYKRVHLGNDLMGSIGTPIIAVESGIIEACRLESIWRMEDRDYKF